MLLSANHFFNLSFYIQVKVSRRKVFGLAGFYFPFTWYFVLFVAAAFLSYQWVLLWKNFPNSSYDDIFGLLLKIAIWFCAVMLVIALISVIISFVFFIWKKRKDKITFTINTKTDSAVMQASKAIQLSIHPVLKPFLGFLKIRLRYDEGRYSNKFSLVEQSYKKVFSTKIEGVYYWLLPEIKEYKILKAIIYFEDLFQFFSLAVPINTSDRFITSPPNQASKNISLFPRKTENANTRIDEIKKVQGEYLSYKNFEDNDDVRRIVWKIYARNKELVVRIPEILDAYASHVYLYASFFSEFNFEGNEVIEIPFLNYYKTIIWNVYKQLIEQNFEVRFIADHNIQQVNSMDAQQVVKYSISTSNWHHEKNLLNYVRTNDAAMVIVSSLSDSRQVKELVEKYGNNISFVFVELSQSLNKQHFGDWIQWFFVQQEKDETAMFKTRWSLSLLRPKILENEKKLKKILEQYQKTVSVK